MDLESRVLDGYEALVLYFNGFVVLEVENAD